tara:strand:- start:918 stop:1340 length:423 start_codon:yes stop_codon:yes gene_type:complete
MSNENCSGVQGRDFQPSDQAAIPKGQHEHPAGEQPAFVPASPQGRPAQLACAAPVFSAELKASADVLARNSVISALNSSSGSWISGPLAFTALIAAPHDFIHLGSGRRHGANPTHQVGKADNGTHLCTCHISGRGHIWLA